MKKLYLLRHGQTDWNAEGRYQGQTDVPLNETGREQARQLAREMAGKSIDALYASDLSRAVETATSVAQLLKLELSLVPELREIHQGKWEGMLFPDIVEKYSQQLQDRKSDPLNVAPPGGETVGEFQERVMGGFKKLLSKHSDGDSIAVVSHGFTIAIARVVFSELDIRSVWDYVPHNTEITFLEID